VKLKRLILQGFKSFKDRQIINFDDGITGIVGPNGCGKSNIVDALFWVMGAQSAKHLRGDNMKDLIFAGSSKYNPASFAEASLVLENDTGKHIHIGNKVSSPSEIMLTRKLYRNGDTEYRINNLPARLRDIQEVFMDTGAGAKSYSIIAQGEINRLVQAKPIERRTMIEEVAGITKFKIRKRESLKKIEQTQSNLARLNDLQQEIEKNLKALQKQAEKAERARSLKEKVRRNDIVVNAHKVFDHLKDLRDGKTILNEKTIEIETWTTQKDSLEVSLEEERYKKDEQTEKIESLQLERNEVSNKLAAAEERLNSLCKSMTDKEKQIETREKEMTELLEELSERKEKLTSLQTEVEELKARNEEETNFTELEEKVELMKEELELKSTQVTDLKETIDIEKEELQGLDQTIFQNNSKLEEFSGNLQDIATEIEVLEKQYSGVSTDIADERDAVNEAEKLSNGLVDQDQLLKTKVEELLLQTRDLEKDLKEKSKETITVESKLTSLKEINASLEGVKEGASEFLQNIDSEQFQLLGNLIKCDEKYTKSVQLLLNDYMDTLVASTDELNDFYSWCSTNKEKAVDFLIADKAADLTSDETIERIQLALGTELTKLNDILDIPEEFKARLTPFFDGYYIVEEMNEDKFSTLSPSIKFKAITTTAADTTIKNVGEGKLLSLAGANEGNGVIARNNMIVELEAKLVELTAELEALEAKVITSNEELDTNREEQDDIRNQMADAKADFAAKKSALESKLTNLETGNARLDILKNRKSEISKSRLELLESEESLGNKQKDLKERLDDNQARYEEIYEEYNTQKATYDEEREAFLEKQVEAKSFEDRLQGMTSQIDDVESQIEKQSSRIESNKSLIDQFNEEITTVSEELETLETSNQETSEELQDKDEVLSMLKDDLTELLLSMQEREDEVKKLGKSITANDKLITEMEIKLEQAVNEEEEIVKNIFEKYRVDLREAIGRYLEYEEVHYLNLNDVSTMYFIETENGQQEIEKEEYEFTRRYGQDLKDCASKFKQYKQEYARLGEINWQAIEDYERQKLRFDFLKVQEEELRGSLEDLEAAITHIDDKSKERFKTAFEEVNVRFEKVFPIIFGGGEARLEVIGKLDDPDCGVDIIAKPPGKKMQNINLMSGGEKAMTAVSLIFSIFLVKPSPFCLLDEVDAPLDDANVGRFNELLREMSQDSQFILITHNKKTMELNDVLYGVTMQEPGVSKAVSVQLQ
jgi:chromosome segregation protein